MENEDFLDDEYQYEQWVAKRSDASLYEQFLKKLGANGWTKEEISQMEYDELCEQEIKIGK
jgi:hypothetical protein